MQRLMLLSLAFIGLFAKVAQAGCANACSGHGICSKNDVCHCGYQWTGNDCSQRQCQFFPSWVDSGAGDLNFDGVIEGVDVTVGKGSNDFPKGRTEKYTSVLNSDLEVVPNTAHGYFECANKGICDRSTGTCDCFDGFSGSGCQYRRCYNDCSGHGTCVSKRELAYSTNENQYAFWDKDSLLGCQCDGGYTGADCSEKTCPIGVDPLAVAGYKALSKNNFTFEVFTTGTGAGYAEGNYSLYFEDAQGIGFQTALLPINSACSEIRKAIQELPMKMLDGAISCHRSTASRGYIFHNGTGFYPAGEYGQELYRAAVSREPHDFTKIKLEGQETIEDKRFVYEKFTLVFDTITRQLKTPLFNIYNNGLSRPTLQAFPTAAEKLHTRVYRNGFKADDTDIFYSRCNGVLASLSGADAATNKYSTLSNLDTLELDLLKKCLGDADGDNSNNVEVSDWDHGTILNPHMAQIVEETENQAFEYDPKFAEEWNTFNFWSKDGRNFDRRDNSVVPTTRICDGLSSESARFNESLTGESLCSNKGPAPIVIVLYWVNSDSVFAVFNPVSKIFNLLANNDYTQFSIWTTTSTLVNINPYVVALTHRHELVGDDELGQDFTNVVHTTNTTDGTSANNWQEATYGNTACENVIPTGVSSSGNGYQTCTNVGDEVLLIVMPGFEASNPNSAAIPGASPDSYVCNPIYTNTYTVEKTWQQTLSSDTVNDEPVNYDSRHYRNMISFDSGTNAKFNGDCSATMYKIVRNTTEYPNGGPVYRGECSMRGDCETSTGNCKCRTGFHGPSCGVQDAQARGKAA